MLLYNNDFLPRQDLRLPISNRAFQYNDGFFETIMVVAGKLRFWAEHQQRMREAAAALHLAIPANFWDGELEDNLLQLAKQRNALAYGRLKLKVWRSGAGLYTPQSNKIDWLATVEQSQPIPETGLSVGICETVRACHSPLSHFKGPQAPLYVMAGIEKQTRGFDDMLLLDGHGHVAELISSNIFWLKNEVLCTPGLETGCVNGILRRNILRWCQQQGIAVQEVQAKPNALLEAEVVFAANVTCISPIIQLENDRLAANYEILTKLKAGLQV